jgi:hypothetical protein
MAKFYCEATYTIRAAAGPSGTYVGGVTTGKRRGIGMWEVLHVTLRRPKRGGGEWGRDRGGRISSGMTLG